MFWLIIIIIIVFSIMLYRFRNDVKLFFILLNFHVAMNEYNQILYQILNEENDLVVKYQQQHNHYQICSICNNPNIFK